jgi:UDP-N-acetyl-D-galactosamine dehydrogenase
MGVFVAQKVIKLISNKGIPINTARILILGITFKENCPDIRNTKIVDIYNELISFGASADIYDPWANKNEVEKGYGIKLLPDIDTEKDYTAIIVAVAHDSFKDFDFKKYKSKGSLIFDTKGMIDKSLTDARL